LAARHLACRAGLIVLPLPLTRNACPCSEVVFRPPRGKPLPRSK
jgi:hypothetical protein